jgi:hypothetical protein
VPLRAERADFGSELSAVIEAWPDLLRAIRAGILAMAGPV